MKQVSLAEKLARKSFESAAIQQSWQVHLNTFGPLLRDSFSENYSAKTHLCAALNRISRRDGEGGRKELAELDRHLESPMDHAAYHFFTALSFEAEGDFTPALTHYLECCGYEPDFYMPWVKIAKLSQTAQDYDTGKKGWQKAVSLAPTSAHKAVFLTNLCGCLIHMHRFEEAYAALMESRQLAARQPGRDAVAAIYYAATGDAENAENCLSLLEADSPDLAAATRASAERILRGENPRYSPMQTDPEQLDAFWVWFREWKHTRTGLSENLQMLFPFPDREIPVAVEGNTIYLADLYMTALKEGYNSLLARCPADIREQWRFEIIPYCEFS